MELCALLILYLSLSMLPFFLSMYLGFPSHSCVCCRVPPLLQTKRSVMPWSISPRSLCASCLARGKCTAEAGNNLHFTQSSSVSSFCSTTARHFSAKTAKNNFWNAQYLPGFYLKLAAFCPFITSKFLEILEFIRYSIYISAWETEAEKCHQLEE